MKKRRTSRFANNIKMSKNALSLILKKITTPHSLAQVKAIYQQYWTIIQSMANNPPRRPPLLSSPPHPQLIRRKKNQRAHKHQILVFPFVHHPIIHLSNEAQQESTPPPNSRYFLGRRKPVSLVSVSTSTPTSSIFLSSETIGLET